MTKFIDLSVRDISGACVIWTGYLAETLGYDYEIDAQVGVHNGRGEIYLRAGDRFQSQHSTYSSDHVGRVFHIETFEVEEEWEAATARVWEKLKKAMPRDERELRAGLKMMSGIVEHAPSFKSAVGMMFAERIKAARNEATNYMIEHHGWAAEA